MLKIRLRRISGDSNYPEPADLGEPFIDALHARLGFDFGGDRPRFYPRLDRFNNMIMHPGTVIKGRDAEGIDEINDTYIGFGEPGTPNVERIRVVVNDKRLVNFDPDKMRVLLNLLVDGVADIKQMIVRGNSEYHGSHTFHGPVNFGGGTNIEFGDAVLPTASEENDFLTAGPGETRRWSSPQEVLFGTPMGGMILANSQEPGFNIDARSEAYSILIDSQPPLGFMATSADSLANSFTEVGLIADFTRASFATRVNRVGNLELVGNNVSRSHYNVTTREKLGLRLEGPSINPIGNKHTHGIAAGAGVAGTLPTGMALEGFTPAEKTIVGFGTYKGSPYFDIRFQGTNNTGSILNAALVLSSMEFSAIAGQLWTGSLYFQWLNANIAPASAMLRLRSHTATDGSVVGVVDNFSIIPYIGQPWSRQKVSHRVQAGANRLALLIAFGITAGASYDFTLRVGGRQIENLPSSSSLILNDNSARSRDVFTLPATEPYLRAEEGTALIWFRPNMISVDHPSNNPTVWIATDDPSLASNANYLQIMWDRTSNILRGIVSSAGIITTDMYIGGVTEGALHKVVFAWKANDFAAILDGGAIVTDELGNPPLNLVSQSLGSNGIANDAFIDLMRFKTFRRRLTNAELTSLVSE